MSQQWTLHFIEAKGHLGLGPREPWRVWCYGDASSIDAITVSEATDRPSGWAWGSRTLTAGQTWMLKATDEEAAKSEALVAAAVRLRELMAFVSQRGVPAHRMWMMRTDEMVMERVSGVPFVPGFDDHEEWWDRAQGLLDEDGRKKVVEAMRDEATRY